MHLDSGHWHFHPTITHPRSTIITPIAAHQIHFALSKQPMSSLNPNLLPGQPESQPIQSPNFPLTTLTTHSTILIILTT